MSDFLDQVYYHNTVRQYLITAGIILGGFLVVLIFKRLIIKHLQAWASKTPGTWDDLIVENIGRSGMPVIFWTIVYWGIHLLEMSDSTARVIRIAASIVITFYVLRVITSVIVQLIKSAVRRRGHSEAKIRQLGGLIMIINGIVWILGALFLLSNWGVQVAPILAGLGIGGIAVALAAQNILGDVFNYFVIFFDRPFEAGDFIIVDDKLGTIEYVGIKTTHIRSLSGEQIVIGNANLTSSRIHNYKRMLERRVVFTINVELNTPLPLVEKIPALLKSAVERQQRVRFDRAHFASYSDWGLRFEIVYYVLSPDYNVYMDTQQAINLAIYKEFESLHIRFAFPTQSLFIKPSSPADGTQEKV